MQTFFLSIFFQRDGSHGGAFIKEKGGWNQWCQDGFGSTMQSPANCVCFSQNLLCPSFLCVICQSLLKGKFRSSNAQKPKLAEARVKSSHIQCPPGAAVQGTTDLPAQSQPPGLHQYSPFLGQQCSNCIQGQEINLTNSMARGMQLDWSPEPGCQYRDGNWKHSLLYTTRRKLWK